MKKRIILKSIIIFILITCGIIGLAYHNIESKETISQIPEDSIIESNENIMDIVPDSSKENQNEIIVEDISTSEVEKEPTPTVEEKVKEEPKKVQEVVTPKQSSASIQPSVKVESSTKSNTSSTKNNTNTSKSVTTTQIESKQDTSKPTETKKTETQKVETQKEETPTRCTNNHNHGMDVGNSGQWFSTKNEAIAYYENKINYWGNLWETDQIDDATYYKNCPKGYEIWSCMYCSKWTINFYYR